MLCQRTLSFLVSIGAERDISGRDHFDGQRREVFGYLATLGEADLARKAREQEKSLAGYAEAMQCHLGDFVEYAGIRRELSDLERKQARNTETRPAISSICWRSRERWRRFRFSICRGSMY